MLACSAEPDSMATNSNVTTFHRILSNFFSRFTDTFSAFFGGLDGNFLGHRI